MKFLPIVTSSNQIANSFHSSSFIILIMAYKVLQFIGNHLFFITLASRNNLNFIFYGI